MEKLSGKDMKRPQLQAMLATVQSGDTLVVESISRFARNTRDLLDIVEQLTAKGVEFVSLKEQLDTHTPTGKFVLTMFAAHAPALGGTALRAADFFRAFLYELERSTLLDRQRDPQAIFAKNAKIVRATVHSGGETARREVWADYNNAVRGFRRHRAPMGARRASVQGSFDAHGLETSHILQPFAGVPGEEREEVTTKTPTFL
jgi:hypothetical protein